MTGCCIVLLLIASSLVAARCDDAFVTNTVWLRRVISTDSEVNVSYSGCKKGCYWKNETDSYNEYGALKCLKCSEIQDEFNCTSNIATCQWKKDKCVSQSCPGIAKAHVSLTNTSTTTQWADNNTAISSRVGPYTQAVKFAKECVDGSALEVHFNQAYLEDYKNYVNYKYTGGTGTGTGTSPFGGSTSCTGTPVNNCDPASTTCVYPNGTKCDSIRCLLNSTLSLASSLKCVDRVNQFISGSADYTCRLLPEFARQQCIFKETSEQSETFVFTDSTNTTCRPGTKLEKCIQDGNRERDTVRCYNSDGTTRLCTAAEGGTDYPLMDDARRLKKYGYSTVAEICQNDLQQRLGLCEEIYKYAIGYASGGMVYSGPYSTSVTAGCYNGIIGGNVVTPATKEHNRLVSKGQRGACHHVYGCMFSKSNGRCSYWSVWAFVLALVLSIVFVCAVVIVVLVVVVVPKIRGKKHVGAVSDGGAGSSGASDTNPLVGTGSDSGKGASPSGTGTGTDAGAGASAGSDGVVEITSS